MRHLIRNGPLLLEVVTSNDAQWFGGYFSRAQYLDQELPPNYSIQISEKQAFPKSEALRSGSPSVCLQSKRERGFADGYYTSSYFGEPVLASHSKNYTRVQLVGPNCDLIVFRHYLKLFLTIQSFDSDALHLKAACIECGPHSYLVVAAGEGGKTTFVHSMMEQGAGFVSNSQVMLGMTGAAKGIHSNIRFREVRSSGRFTFESAIVSRGDGYLVDPLLLYGQENLRLSTQLTGIIFLKRGARSTFRFEALAPRVAASLASRLSEAINFYDLKEDVLDYAENDLSEFSRLMMQVDEKLQRVFQAVPSYYVEVDVLDENVRPKLHDMLASARLP
jgi:hypothetical protein